MKCYDVVGYAHEGELYCPEHTPDRESPLFLQDASPGDYCDECLAQWIATTPAEERTAATCTAYLEGCEPESENGR